MPTLRQLVPGSKRRSRADLTVEMISAPLADFRHTMHIGRGGDAFGDTSFLSAKHETSNRVQKNGRRTSSPARDHAQTLRRPQSATRRSAVEGGWSLEEMELTPPPAESMLSFHIDLGPSILTDVLGVMDQSERLQQNLTAHQTQKLQHRKTPSLLECVSTSCSATQQNAAYESQTWSSTYSVNINDRDFLFMDEEEEEEEEEIRV